MFILPLPTLSRREGAFFLNLMAVTIGLGYDQKFGLIFQRRLDRSSSACQGWPRLINQAIPSTGSGQGFAALAIPASMTTSAPFGAPKFFSMCSSVLASAAHPSKVWERRTKPVLSESKGRCRPLPDPGSPRDSHCAPFSTAQGSDGLFSTDPSSPRANTLARPKRKPPTVRIANRKRPRIKHFPPRAIRPLHMP